MRVGIFSIAMILALAAPSYAQVNLAAPNAKFTTQEEVDQAIKQEKDYKATMQKMPDQKASNDPWGTIRTNNATPADAKTKKKTKASTQ